MTEPEHYLQVAFVSWCGLQLVRHPELAKIFAIPNGGKRGIQVAIKIKEEGARAGASDLMLPVARSGYHGLFLETKIDEMLPRKVDGHFKMKRVRTDLSPEQRRFKAEVEAEGYAHRTYRSLEEGQKIVVDYLNNVLGPEAEDPPERARKPNIAAITKLRESHRRKECPPDEPIPPTP